MDARTTPHLCLPLLLSATCLKKKRSFKTRAKNSVMARVPVVKGTNVDANLTPLSSVMRVRETAILMKTAKQVSDATREATKMNQRQGVSTSSLLGRRYPETMTSATNSVTGMIVLAMRPAAMMQMENAYVPGLGRATTAIEKKTPLR